MGRRTTTWPAVGAVAALLLLAALHPAPASAAPDLAGATDDRARRRTTLIGGLTLMIRRSLLHAVVALAVTVGALAVPASAAPPWLAPTTLSNGIVDAEFLQLAVNAHGDAMAVWGANASTTAVIQAAWRPAGGEWGLPVDLSDPGGFAQEPVVAVDDAGGATVAWRQIGFATVITARTRTPAGIWEPPVPLSTDSQAFHPSIAIGTDSAVTLAWYEGAGVSLDTVIWTARRPAGGGWQPSEPRAPQGQFFDPVLAADGGVVALAYRDRISGKDRIRATIRAENGTWSSPLEVSPVGLAATDPQVAVGPDGRVLVAWHLNTGTDFVTQAVSRSAAGLWGGVATLSAGTGVYPSIAIDATGTEVAAWLTGDNKIVGSVRPPGGAWSAQQPISDPDLGTGTPTIAADHLGNTVVVWAAFESGAVNGSIRASRRGPGGAFVAPVEVAPPAFAEQNIPALALADSGDGVALFQRSNGSHLVAQAANLDVTAPSVSAFSVPANGTTGKPLTFAATASDVWSAVSSYQWSFGDGSTATGASVAHAYATEGSHTVTLTVTDGVGNAAIRSATTIVTTAIGDAPLPSMTVFKLTKKKIAIGEKTKLKVDINTASTLKIVIKSKHKHLVKGKRKYLKVVLRKSLPAGLSRITIKTKVKGKKLKPDTYKVIGTASNPTGTSPKKMAKLIVVRP